jgi:hypothetical protein
VWLSRTGRGTAATAHNPLEELVLVFLCSFPPLILHFAVVPAFPPLIYLISILFVILTGRALVKHEVTEVSNKNIPAELAEAKSTISRLVASVARSLR